MQQDIKPELMKKAHEIVDEFRRVGGDINELVAKAAASENYSDAVTDRLINFVNRHNFKEALLQDANDEPVVADPAAVKRARLQPLYVATKQASAITYSLPVRQTASRNTSLMAGRQVPQGDFFDSVAFQKKADLEYQLKLSNALSEDLSERLSRKLHLVKTVGLEKTAAIRDQVDQELQACVVEHIQKCAAETPSLAAPDLRMLIPVALGDLVEATKIARDLITMTQKVSDISAELAALSQ